MSFHSPAEELAICTSLGLGLISQLVALLGLLGLLSLPAVVTAAIVLLALTREVWWLRLRDLVVPSSAGGWRRWGAQKSWTPLVLVGVLGLLYPLLLLPLYPPADFDTTAYHLPTAKALVESGEIAPTPYLRFPVGPLNAHMLFALFLLVQGDASAQALGALGSVLVALGLFAWGGRFGSARVGWIAVALWFSNTLVLDRSFSAATYHLFAALMCFMAVWCMTLHLETARRHWLLLSAVFCGLAVGTYYVALFFLGALGLVAAYVSARERAWRPGVTFALVAIVVSSPWYLRNAWHTGNPVWPFFSQVFGAGGWWSEADLRGVMQNLGGLGVSRSLVSFLRLPYDLTFNPGPFQPTGEYSMAYLLSLPLLVAVGWALPHARALATLSCAFGLFWFFGAQALRYLLPALPFLTLAVAMSYGAVVERASRHARPLPRRLLDGAVVAFLLFPAWWFAHAALQRSGPVPTTPEVRDSYLARKLRGYPAIRIANSDPGSVYALGGLNLAYYSEGPFYGDVVGPARYALARRAMATGDALREFLQGYGARYLIVALPDADALPNDEGFDRYFRLLYADSRTHLFSLEASPRSGEWPPAERLENGGFESAEEGGLFGWQRMAGPHAEEALDVVELGSRAVRLRPGALVSQTVAVAPSTACALRQRARARRRDSILVSTVEWLDSSGGRLGHLTREIDTIREWRSYALRGIAPAAVVRARVSCAGKDGQVLLDAVSFTCLGNPWAPRPSSVKP